MTERRKIFARTLIIIIALAGAFVAFVISIMLSLNRFEVFIKTCHSAKHLLLEELIFIEYCLAPIFVCIYIFLEFFDFRKNFLRNTLLVFTANLILVGSQVLFYPLVVSKSWTWGSRLTETKVFTHPLFYITILTG